MPKTVEVVPKYADESLSLALNTMNLGKQAFVFVNAKRSAEKCAEEISKKIKTSSTELDLLSEKVAHVLSKPTRQCERLAQCIKKGIAFHHAGLAGEQREIIEDEFRKGTIKIICCTPTLAAGVDLPAFRTIIRDLKRYGHSGLNWIPVLEYMQQAGRAGRPKFDTVGEAIVIAGNETEKEILVEKYLKGEPEEIYSKLAVEPALRTYLLSLIASDFVNSHDKIYEFFSKTFWAHQFKDMNKLQHIIDRMLGLLESWEFIKGAEGINSLGNEDSFAEAFTEEGDFISADKIQTLNSRKKNFNEKIPTNSEPKGVRIYATPLGKRVAELYLDPYTANYLVTNLKKSITLLADEFSLLHLVSYTLEMRPLLSPRAKDHEPINEALLMHEAKLFEKEPSMFEDEYDEYLASIKTAMFLNEWISEKDEEFLLEEYNVRPGEIRGKLDVADWLLYSCEELARIMQLKNEKNNDIIKSIKKTRFRLKYGIKEELIALVRLEGIGRVRARILFNNKIKDIADIKKADFSKLKQLLGEKVAENVKRQVDDDPTNLEVKPNKRKGQIALGDYDG